MKQKKLRNNLFWILCFVFFIGIIFIPDFKKSYKSNKYDNYSTTQVESFEKRLFGATGWAAVDLNLKTSADNNSANVTNNNESIVVPTGAAFTILGESGDFWQIKYGEYYGYIESKYCMINLPDVIPSIKYNIVNASGSIYRSKGNDIPNVTGEVLYGTNCENGICQKINGTGKVTNARIGRDEYIVPATYATAVKIGKAESLIKEQNSANNRDWSLMIYDSYRPASVSQKVSQEFGGMITPGSDNYNADIYNGISGWCSPLNADADDCKTFFLSTNVSSHNQGAAVDVSLWDNNAGSEVTGSPTTVHELSEEAARCNKLTYSSGVNNCTFSTGMSGSQMAQYLSTVMTNENVGMRPISSEWWHFQDDNTLDSMNDKTSTTGRNFQVTSIVSTYGYPKTFTNLVGDVNADGIVNVSDAELIYNTYELLGECDTCDDIKSQADYNQDGSVNLDDIYDILNRNNDLLTSNYYTIGDDYILIGDGIFDPNLIGFNGSGDTGVTYTFNDVRYEFSIKLNGNIIKSYVVISYSYTGNASIDLSKSYIFLEGGVSQLTAEVTSNNLSCTNCAILYNTVTNKLYISRGESEEQAVASFDLVYYTSDYDFDDSFNIYHTTVEDLLSGFECDNCIVEIYNDSSKISSGDIPDGSQLVIKETVSGRGDVIATTDINFLINVSGIELDRTSLDLYTGQNRLLTVIVSPSNAANKSVTWSSSDENVATVVDGTVTAVGVGETTITATTEDGGYSASCSVTVNQKYNVKYKWGSEEHEYITQSYSEGDDVISGFDEPNLMYAQGKKLIGWTYNNQDYDLDDELLMPSHNIELVARWRLISDDITRYGVVDAGSINKLLTSDSPKTGVSTFISNLTSQVGSEYSISVYKSDNITIKTSGFIGTGDIVKLYVNNVVVDKYTVSIKGDLNGNGMVNVMDLNELRSLISSQGDIDYCHKYAGDMNNSGKVNVMDLNELRAYIKSAFNS